LAEAGVPFEIVPGITAAVAAPAVAGIPVTHRGVTSGVLVVSGHAHEAYAPVLSALAPGSVTVVVLMGFAERAGVAQVLMERGWPGGTPAAIISNASQAEQRIWTGPLAALGGALVDARHEEAHTVVIGEVVSLGAVIARGMSTASALGREHESGPEDPGPRAPVVRA
jgi:uroporphyrin-III C-methyltransferase/precorrin-2 dehydrogenase/sirohydrochlorin ferrochelatase